MIAAAVAIASSLRTRPCPPTVLGLVPECGERPQQLRGLHAEAPGWACGDWIMRSGDGADRRSPGRSMVSPGGSAHDQRKVPPAACRTTVGYCLLRTTVASRCIAAQRHIGAGSADNGVKGQEILPTGGQ
jgi:hypothetical protein